MPHSVVCTGRTEPRKLTRCGPATGVSSLPWERTRAQPDPRRPDNGRLVKRMLLRRQCLIASLVLADSGLLVRSAWAQAAERAMAFVQQTGDRLVAIVNGNLTPADKRRGLAQIMETSIDIDGIGRFCLGRFWRTASPDQQKRFVA